MLYFEQKDVAYASSLQSGVQSEVKAREGSQAAAQEPSSPTSVTPALCARQPSDQISCAAHSQVIMGTVCETSHKTLAVSLVLRVTLLALGIS